MDFTFIVTHGTELIEFISIMFLDHIKNMRHQVVFIEIEILDKIESYVYRLLCYLRYLLFISVV